MSQSNRGAAQVSMMWAIAFLLIALVSIFVAYSTSGTLTDVRGELETARAEVTTARNALSTEKNRGTDLSRVVGWQPSTNELSSEDLIKNSIQQLGSVFPNADENSSDIESMLPIVISDYNAATARVADLEREVQELRDSLQSRQDETTTALADKDSTINDLQSELDDTRNSLSEQIVDLERQRDALRDQYRELDDRLTQTVAEKDAEIAAIRKAGASMKQRNDILSSQVNEVARRADSADGSVLTANARINKAWIDLGRASRVTPGLQFEVLDASSGQVKGRLEVATVEESRAECKVLHVADEYNPIGSGDQVRNAVFDPNRQQVAVLLGNGFGSLSADDMKVKLATVGISVVDNVTVETDYLLLGTPFFDEETGDILAWEQQQAYQTARGLSVEIVPRRDWLVWLGL